jgi:hypothetical protein
VFALKVWLARLGVVGFFFFLGKGLVWLAVGAAAIIYGCR